jgi:hypothetical protein
VPAASRTVLPAGGVRGELEGVPVGVRAAHEARAMATNPETVRYILGHR